MYWTPISESANYWDFPLLNAISFSLCARLTSRPCLVPQESDTELG
jgi:hypothetical protein